jgi:saccharopine dehydrogenase-like NADP-dependent oxidoreductase
MSGDEPHRFPKPIGIRRPMYTIHSEVATLPLSYQNQGVREVSFKIAFDPEFVERVRFLRDLGLGSHEPIEVSGVKVRPVDVVNKIAMNQPPSKQVGPLKQYEVVRAIVKGVSEGKKITWICDCHTAGMPKWGIGLDIDTGSPPAVAAQMLAAGEITAVGALPPELAVPPEPFFKRLKLRKMTLKVAKKAGWAFRV